MSDLEPARTPPHSRTVPEGNGTLAIGSPAARIFGFAAVLALDAAIVIASYAAALALRFDGDIPSQSIDFFLRAAPGIVLPYLLGNYFFRIYRTAWQYAGIADAINLALSVGTVSIILFGVNAFMSPRHIPLTVNVTAPALIYLAMGATKLWPRLRRANPLSAWSDTSKRVLIVGAGHTGQFLARELLSNPGLGLRPVAFVDDDPRKRGLRLHGVVVEGARQDIPALVKKREIQLIALAIPSAPGSAVRDIIGICQRTGVPLRTVPGLRDLVRSGPGAAHLREVTVEDLLGRPEVEIDARACSDALRGRAVLITGAAGYIGAELARQVFLYEPAMLHLLDSNETGLYDLQRELEAARTATDVRIWLCDVGDEGAVRRAFDAARPEIVFHGAAYKHIPVLEEYPEAALQTNIVGTLNVARAAQETGARKFVFISSDKAVDPDNVYGASKRIGELLMAALADHGPTVFCAVRFGNVMGSRGSVVPLFLSQIERGGPVLLTHPEATRYFMSAPEAVSLVIQSAAFAGQGQIFILEMGEVIKIADLAENLIRLKGLEPGVDVKIEYTGLRPGERLHEELVGANERLVPTQHPKILRVEGRPNVSAEELVRKIEELAREAPQRREELAARIHALARLDRRDTAPTPAPAAPENQDAR